MVLALPQKDPKTQKLTKKKYAQFHGRIHIYEAAIITIVAVNHSEVSFCRHFLLPS